jgi:hypothetical protein
MKLRSALLLVFVAASLHAQPVPRCSAGLQLLTAVSGQEITIPAAPVTGATRYRVQIASRWSVIDLNHFLIKGTIDDQTFSPGQPIRETFYNTHPGFAYEVYVTVISEVPHDDGSRTLCAQDFLVDIQPDAGLARNATRAVVPAAGSVRGAFNSVFRTRLLLENRWDIGTLTGRIIFHRRDTAGSSSDPSIAYSLEPHTFVTYDDIVGAMQLDGVVGSLDIVPDVFPSGAYALPQVRADLISVGANGGEYSASIPVVTSTSGYSGALLGTPQFLVEPPRNKRISVAIRSLADPVEITALLIAPDRTERARTTRQYAADFYEQTPLSSWFNDLQQPGDTILFFVHPSSTVSWTAGAIVLLGETDNVTNDVTIVSPTELQTLSQPVVVCANGHGCSVL